MGHLTRGKQYFSHVTVTDVTDKQIECTITPFFHISFQSACKTKTTLFSLIVSPDCGVHCLSKATFHLKCQYACVRSMHNHQQARLE